MANGALNHCSNVAHDLKMLGNRKFNKAHNSGSLFWNKFKTNIILIKISYIYWYFFNIQNVVTCYMPFTKKFYHTVQRSTISNLPKFLSNDQHDIILCTADGYWLNVHFFNHYNWLHWNYLKFENVNRQVATRLIISEITISNSLIDGIYIRLWLIDVKNYVTVSYLPEVEYL